MPLVDAAPARQASSAYCRDIPVMHALRNRQTTWPHPLTDAAADPVPQMPVQDQGANK
ncbi:hypothetical protein [Streptomyces sp. NPDC056660]|uniref:hypothetical protein n=1 Tax=Streptomyces sp. NPDC056660 TaxID=3345897 RepID=UPI0036B1AB79